MEMLIDWGIQQDLQIQSPGPLWYSQVSFYFILSILKLNSSIFLSFEILTFSSLWIEYQ